ncbi:hypothetical protein CLAFUW4_09920 [Fulvia fulva]|uniref:Uncharacterized protein n=1 Tax=Passalora fulva TaxID=5499 RepID=A0A9Q8UUB1_PASFU|nr:uncharacterized protein CLAFUR5_12323 [Fulvia fulva]KAK4616012.1 hypothetical protein CLAFUR4_09925 [Fulvia fulva]KAK4616762.1 hypothetical protein CLAFUR0_09919 [Fulvia fulva]UJO22764.1 hypothetical protein CLAFUR5_12323 [Fulvia fulva]WPV19013.1 hypothetical protein CLAFUW4_09920 [Fulvia fulva]WPV34224.1 hypothetical protein CLAFUW7_09922 [Fulvia fulva]
MQPFAEQFVAHLDTLSPIEIEQTIEAVRAGHEQTRKEARNINTKRFKESASLNAATGSQSHDASIVGDGEDVVFRADDIERGLVDRAELPSAYTAARRSVSNSWRSIGGEPYFKHKMSEAEERSTTVDYADHSPFSQWLPLFGVGVKLLRSAD